MLILITGGSASGKSELGEELCTRLGGELIYIATMIPNDAESRIRVARHRMARSSRNFTTVEQYRNIGADALPVSGCTVLLECMGTLVSNELFTEKTKPELLLEKVMDGVESLTVKAANVVIITNDVFGGAETYTGEMAMYLNCLAEINRNIGRRADVVIESVCGIPVYTKGRELLP